MNDTLKHADFALGQEIDRLKEENGELKRALECMKISRDLFGKENKELTSTISRKDADLKSEFEYRNELITQIHSIKSDLLKAKQFLKKAKDHLGYPSTSEYELKNDIESFLKSDPIETPSNEVNNWKFVAIKLEEWLRNYGPNEVTIINHKSEFHLGARLCLEWIQKHYLLTPKVDEVKPVEQTKKTDMKTDLKELLQKAFQAGEARWGTNGEIDSEPTFDEWYNQNIKVNQPEESKEIQDK